MRYIAGLLFNKDHTATALVYKLRGPSSVVGKWNAIGGKVEETDESSHAAMVREFREETGVLVNAWTHFLTLRGVGWSVDFYHTFSDAALSQVRTVEEETIKVFYIDSLPPTVPNLRWIIPMALGHLNDSVYVYEVNEKEIL